MKNKKVLIIIAVVLIAISILCYCLIKLKGSKHDDNVSINDDILIEYYYIAFNYPHRGGYYITKGGEMYSYEYDDNNIKQYELVPVSISQDDLNLIKEYISKLSENYKEEKRDFSIIDGNNNYYYAYQNGKKILLDYSDANTTKYNTSSVTSQLLQIVHDYASKMHQYQFSQSN